MFTDIKVFSREDLVEYSAHISTPTIIISISDVGASVPVFSDNPNIVDVLNLFFDDEESGPCCMSESDAAAIVDLMKQYADANVDLFFHCNAGVSRSAACAAAAMLINWGDDSDIFNDGRYCPNMHCYRLLLNSADITYDEIEIARKEKQQFDLWRMEHTGELT